jgi:hypothetical protein
VLDIAVLDIAVLDIAVLDTAVLDIAVLDIAVLDIAVLDIAVLDIAVLDIAVLDIAVLDSNYSWTHAPPRVLLPPPSQPSPPPDPQFALILFTPHSRSLPPPSLALYLSYLLSLAKPKKHAPRLVNRWQALALVATDNEPLMAVALRSGSYYTLRDGSFMTAGNFSTPDWLKPQTQIRDWGTHVHSTSSLYT